MQNHQKTVKILYPRFILIVFGLFLWIQPGWAEKAGPPKPPETKKDNIKEILHGVEVTDPYRWLEDQESQETRAWIDAQNEYTDALLGALKGRDKLEKRLAELMKIDVVSTPVEFNGRYFFTKRLADQELSVIYVRKGFEGKDEVLVDPHPMSEDHSVSVNMMDITPDGKILAYGIRHGGEDEMSVRFLDVDTRVHLPEQLPKALYFGLSIKPDHSGFYYTKHDMTEGGRVYYHEMGTGFSEDKEIFGEGFTPEKFIAGSLSEDGKHFLIHVIHGSAAEKTEIYYQNVAEGGPIQTVVNDLNAQFYGSIAGDRIYIQTDWNAPRRRILSVKLADIPKKASEWQEVIGQSDGIISGYSTAGGRLFVNYLENVISKVKVFDPDGKYLREISFPAIGSVSGVVGRWASQEAFFSYSSFHIPPTIYRYHVDKGTQDIWSRLSVPVKSDEFETRQVWFKSKDGTRVPMFLVYKKGLKLDGTHPALMIGYGGFNVNVTPDYSGLAILWAEYGGVFARPNLRGGGEFGEEWHRAAMFEKKQNTFDDFIAAAEWLIENKYTNPEKLAIAGGSNGGLLVGAAMVQRPELFRAVACFYPLLDMLRYHQFLMGRFWVSEYGSADDPGQFKYLRAYSPYHNVRKGVKYPATIFITGDSDTRVAPLHARKMVALLQDATGSDRPILLMYDTQSGHSGGQPLSKQIKDTTDWASFICWQLGMWDK